MMSVVESEVTVVRDFDLDFVLLEMSIDAGLQSQSPSVQLRRKPCQEVSYLLLPPIILILPILSQLLHSLDGCPISPVLLIEVFELDWIPS